MATTVDVSALASSVSALNRNPGVKPADVAAQQNRMTTAVIDAQDTVRKEREAATLEALTAVGEARVNAATVQENSAQFVSDLTRRTQEELAPTIAARESAERTYEEAWAKRQEIVDNGNFNFFSNPLTYVRDHVKMRFQTEKVAAAANQVSAMNRHIDNQYQQAGQQIRDYSAEVAALATAQNNRAFQVTASELAKKQSVVASAEAGIQTTQTLSQQLKAWADPNAADSKLKEQFGDALKYLYFNMHNGDMSHWGEAAKDRMLPLLKSMPKEQLQLVLMGTERIMPHWVVGTNISMGEHRADLAQTDMQDMLILNGILTGDSATQALIRKGEAQRQAEAESQAVAEVTKHPDFAAAIANAGGKLTPEANQYVRRRMTELLKPTTGIDLAKDGASAVATEVRNYFSARRDFIKPQGAANLLESLEAPASVLAWAESETGRGVLSLPHAESGDPLSGMLVASYNSMVASGIPEDEALDGTMKLLRGSAQAELNANGGDLASQADRLTEFGLGGQIFTSLTPRLPEGMLRTRITATQMERENRFEPEAYKRSRDFNASREFLLRQQQQLNLLMPQDLQNFIVRYNKAFPQAANSNR